MTKAMRGFTVVLALLLAACSEPSREMRPMEVTGTVVAPPGVEGPVEVRLFVEWALEGELRHPLQLIEIFPAEAGVPFSHRFDYPAYLGKGLAVYAWIDTDGDGIMCTPTARNDLGGLAIAENGDSEKATVAVTLTEPCRAPGWFFPPAP